MGLKRMRNSGNSYVRNQQEMNNGAVNLKLGGMHLKQISIFPKFRSKNRNADKQELA